MKILTIFTGGTIGCGIPDASGVMRPGIHDAALPPEERYYLLARYCETNRRRAEFDVLEPLSTLSEDMTAGKWEILLHALQETDLTAFDGLVITHGTDTLAYTAALLSEALGGIHTPVVLVAANLNLYDPATNGHQNFAAAIDFIASKPSGGVYCAFSYGTPRTVIYTGSRIRQSRAFSDRYETQGGPNFGFMENGVFTQTGEPEAFTGRKPVKIGALRPCVQRLWPYPGLDYGKIILDPAETKAVLHGVYHSFTVCTEPGSSAVEFAERCAEMGIIAAFAPFSSRILKGGARYASTDALLRTGALFFADCTEETAYAKLLLAGNLSETEADMRRLLGSS